MDWLQAVADLRQRPAHDDGHRVVQIGPLDLLFELDRLDPPREQPLLRPFTKVEREFAAKPATVKIKTRALKKLKDAAL